MIARISGKLIEKKDLSLIIEVSGLCYEVIVPASVLNRIDETKDDDGNVHLITYYYLQVSPASASPILIGFINEIERDFFLQFIKVSGIGPKAAVRALSKPISEITQAIDEGNATFLKTLPGIGAQRAKEIVAKLQGKVGRFGLIQDSYVENISTGGTDWQKEALEVLIQLQYKQVEAERMIDEALERSEKIGNTEELLNEIYKQKVKN